MAVSLLSWRTSSSKVEAQVRPSRGAASVRRFWRKERWRRARWRRDEGGECRVRPLSLGPRPRRPPARRREAGRWWARTRGAPQPAPRWVGGCGRVRVKPVSPPPAPTPLLTRTHRDHAAALRSHASTSSGTPVSLPLLFRKEGTHPLRFWNEGGTAAAAVSLSFLSLSLLFLIPGKARIRGSMAASRLAVRSSDWMNGEMEMSEGWMDGWKREEQVLTAAHTPSPSGRPAGPPPPGSAGGNLLSQVRR